MERTGSTGVGDFILFFSNPNPFTRESAKEKLYLMQQFN